MRGSKKTYDKSMNKLNIYETFDEAPPYVKKRNFQISNIFKNSQQYFTQGNSNSHNYLNYIGIGLGIGLGVGLGLVAI